MSKSKKERFLNIFIETIYLLIVFVTPIYFGVLFVTENPFEIHKMTVFRSLVLFLLFLSLVKISFKANIKSIFLKIFKSYLYIPFLIVLFSLLSILWSVDPLNSFYGDLQRQMGWLSEFYFFLFFALLSLNLFITVDYEEKKRKISRLIFTAVFSSLLVSIYAVMQYFGVDFLLWDEPAAITKRAFSTLGQPNFLGSFLTLTIPLTGYLIKKNNFVYARVFYIFVLAFQLLAILFSGSRSSWIALLLMSIIILFTVFLKNNKKVFYLGISVVFILFIFLSLGSNSISQRFQSAFSFNTGSSSARVVLWSSSLEAIEENIWGYGIENQREALFGFYEPSWAEFSKVNTVFDRAHNIFLDTILTIGIIGLLLLFYFYFYLFKNIYYRIFNSKEKYLFVFLFFSLGAYLISLLFGFATVVTSIYFWMIAAIALSFKNSLTEKEGLVLVAERNKKKIFFSYFILIIIFASCILAFNREVKNLKIDYYFLKTREYFYQGEVPASTVTFSYLREEDPLYSYYNNVFTDMVFSNFTRLNDEASRFLALEEIKNISILLNEKQEKTGFKGLMARFQAYSLLGDFDKAKNILLELKSMSPNYPDIYFKEGKMYEIKGDNLSAINSYKKALSLLPLDDNVDGEINLKALQRYREMIERDIDSLDF
jgi:O-antigen ligase